MTSLTPKVRCKIAHSVAAIQDCVAQLPNAQGFGYGYSFSDPRLTRNWLAILEQQLDRSRERIKTGGVVREFHVDRALQAMQAFRGYLQNVEPVAFLHDTTTKNVLVNGEGLVGIVDIDDICFGDRLYVLGLSYMAILSSKRNTDYIDFWCEAWNLSHLHMHIMRLYTAIHCVGFLSEIGQRFNKDVAEIDYAKLRHLENILDILLP
jgi:aminoglycoside phosphotransferase (APT) family kinase protein